MFSNIDNAIFFFINHNLANPVCDATVKFFIGIPGVFFIILIGIAGLFLGKKYTKISSLIFLSSYAISIFAYKVIKFFIERPRPFITLDNVRLLVGPRDGFSFPSGHAATSFCLATVIAMRYPKLRYPIFIAAILVALSRPYIGVHYPSDILAGAILGIFVGFAVTKTVSKYVEK